jgi:signal peptidase I
MNNATPHRASITALLMSLVLPGFGQLYNGELNRAAWLFLCFAFLGIPGIALIALYLPGGWMMPALLASLALTLLIWLYGMIDAWRGARRRQDRLPQAWQVSGIYMLVLVLCNAIALPLLIGYVRAHQVESFRIPAASMEPSVLKGDFLFADKRYSCPGCKQAVKRGDIAIFAYPNDRTVSYIKRVIGLPGDRVQVKDHEVWVNGKSLKVREAVTPNGLQVTESAGEGQWQVMWTAADKRPPEADLTVPAGQVFVLGDNRNASTDSRSFGTVPLQDVLGKARQIWFSADAHGVRWGRLGKVLD